jgi:hypothetical protein
LRIFNFPLTIAATQWSNRRNDNFVWCQEKSGLPRKHVVHEFHGESPMATVVDIRNPAFFRPPRAPVQQAQGSAEILLFTGVRHERAAASDGPPAGALSARLRDRLKLEE